MGATAQFIRYKHADVYDADAKKYNHDPLIDVVEKGGAYRGAHAHSQRVARGELAEM